MVVQNLYKTLTALKARTAAPGRVFKAFFIMPNSFILAFRDYFKALTIQQTRPKIAYLNGKFICFWYYSEDLIKKLGGEVIL